QLFTRIRGAIPGREAVYRYPPARGIPRGAAAPTNIRHLHDLYCDEMKHWGRYILCSTAFLLFASTALYAQQRYQRWGGGVDDEPLHFGFSVHYINADYKLDLKPSWQDDGYVRVTSPFTDNVGLGLLADLKLTENLNLRLQ